MRILAQDIRFAFRRLNNSPRFSVVAVLTLDAGFGTKNGLNRLISARFGSRV
jgi:hypothetical protein